MEKSIGIYELGHLKIKVYVTDRMGGFCSLIHKDEDTPIIKIGLNYNKFWEVFEVALHEAQEIYCMNKDFRFEATNTMNTDMARFIFLYNHVQFSDMCSSVGEFLESIRPKLIKEWRAAKLKK